jgi:hypothetical protein
MKIPITPELTAIVTGHRKTKAYLHRFKLTDNPMCPCKEGQQTSEHIIYECKNLEAHFMPRVNICMNEDGSLISN